MIYSTNSSDTGTYTVANETVHSMNAQTGATFDFPKVLGELDAVLNVKKQ